MSNLPPELARAQKAVNAAKKAMLVSKLIHNVANVLLDIARNPKKANSKELESKALENIGEATVILYRLEESFKSICKEL